MINYEINIRIFRFETTRFKTIDQVSSKFNEIRNGLVTDVTEIFNTLDRNKVFELTFTNPVKPSEFDKIMETKKYFESLTEV